MDNKFLSGFVGVALIVFSGVIALKSTEVKVNIPPFNAGASSGQEHSFAEVFSQGLFQGGRVATSSTGNVTLPSSAIENATVIDYTQNLASGTLTLPATSTINFMRNPGDTKTFYIRNATTTAGVNITFAGGTGMNYKKATSTKVLLSDTDGSNFAKIVLIRKTNTDIDAIVDLYVD